LTVFPHFTLVPPPQPPLIYAVLFPFSTIESDWPLRSVRRPIEHFACKHSRCLTFLPCFSPRCPTPFGTRSFSPPTARSEDTIFSSFLLFFCGALVFDSFFRSFPLLCFRHCLESGLRRVIGCFTSGRYFFYGRCDRPRPSSHLPFRCVFE